MSLTKEQAVQFLEFVMMDYERGYNKVTNEQGYIWRGNENYRNELGLVSGEELFEQFIKSLE